MEAHTGGDYNCPDATPPQLSVKTWGGGGGSLGGSAGGCRGGLRVPNPNSKGHTTKCGLRVPNPNSRGHATKRGKEKQERKKECNVFAQKEFGAALGPGFCSECRIFTLQQTTFVWRPVLLIWCSKALWV